MSLYFAIDRSVIVSGRACVEPVAPRPSGERGRRAEEGGGSSAGSAGPGSVLTRQGMSCAFDKWDPHKKAADCKNKMQPQAVFGHRKPRKL